MSVFSTAPASERFLAVWAVDQVRRFGGVLEHPFRSRLWPALSLPSPGVVDSFGGFTLVAPQFWWGHRAEKASRFYIVGCAPHSLPEIPFALGEPTHVVATRKKNGNKLELSPAGREGTPRRLAEWLLDVARRCAA